MAVTYFSGFEWVSPPTLTTSGGGLCSAISDAASVSVVTSGRTGGFGSRSLRCNGGGASSSGMTVGGSGFATFYARFYVKFDSAVPPSASLNFIQCTLSAGSTLGVGLQSGAGNMAVRVGAVNTTMGFTPSTGTWYLVQVVVDVSGTTHSITAYARLADNTGPIYTATATEGSSAATVSTIPFGVRANVVADWSFDDLIIHNTKDAYRPLDHGTVVGLYPSGNADHQSITLTEWATATTAFTAFADFTGATESTSAPLLADLDNDDGFRMDAGAGGQAGNARWNFEDTAATITHTPDMVRTIIAVREASSGANDATFRIRDSLDGATANIFTGNPGWATTWNYLALLSTTRPGGGAWTLPALNGLQFEADSTDSAPNIWCAGAVAEAHFSQMEPPLFYHSPSIA